MASQGFPRTLDPLPLPMSRKFVPVFRLLALIGVALTVTAIYLCSRPLALAGGAVEFEIAPGDTMRTVSSKVADAGVDVTPDLLTWIARLSGRAEQIKAGSYRIERRISAWGLVGVLTTGANDYAAVTLVEGWTFSRLRAALNAHPDLRHDTLGLGDREIMRRLGVADAYPEGMFFPDTYTFSRASSDLDVLRRAYRRMQTILAQEWAERAADLPLNDPFEALVLASVVEKETGRAEDRPFVAAVFINRLRAAMPLQSDPTVIYGLGGNFDGNLRKKDLLSSENPYNTYQIARLPPSPIAMPGRAALHATLHPPAVDYLYFVARGDGSSQFSLTLEEHNLAVERYQRGVR